MKTHELLAACLGLLLSALDGRAESSDPSTLSGRVLLPPDRSASATVLILRAAKRTDAPVSTLYPHFPPPRPAERDGRFKFESLDPAWLYHMVVVAPGCRPQEFNHVDPASGPMTVELKSADPGKAPPGTVLRGRVLDARGHAVSGAIIRTHGVTRGDSTRWPADDIDLFSVSDDAGAFMVFGGSAFTAAEGAVEAAGFATALFENWTPGDTVHELRLVEGACLRGRLVHAGEPVAHADVRLDNFGSESGSMFWHYSEFTDDQGRFFFAHLPTNRSCSVYATMASLAERGAMPRQRASVGGNGSTNDLGDLKLDPSFKLEGRIRLSDGKPLPADSQLTLLRSNLVGMQDSLSGATGPDGAFRFIGVPAGPMRLLLRVPGYQLTPRDRLLIAGSSTNLSIVADLTNLVIEMRPQTPPDELQRELRR